MVKFEWDENKARSNLAKHSVSFEQAARAFDDRWSIALYSEVVAFEVRTLLVGLAGLGVLAVVFTERRDVIRIVSARKATKYEQRIYAKNRKD